MPILELPLILMDTPFFASKKDPWEKIVRLVSEVERQGGLLTVLFHHAVYNDKEYPGWSGIYEKLINLCKEKNAWIARGEDVNRWWRTR
jgi:hypothetical protein